MSLLPHRYPFLLVDRVLELDPGTPGSGDQERERQRTVLSRSLAGTADHARSADGRSPGPGRRGLDRRQCHLAAGRVALIASIDGVKLRRPVVPGDQLRLEILGQRIKATAACVWGVAKVGDTLAAEAAAIRHGEDATDAAGMARGRRTRAAVSEPWMNGSTRGSTSIRP